MSDTSGVVDLDSIVGSAAVVLLFCDETAELATALSAELDWYDRHSVRVVLVASGDRPERPLATDAGAGADAGMGNDAPTVADPNGELRERYWPGPHTWPATVVIGRDGSMVARLEGGAPEVHLDRLREAVAAHVAPTPDGTPDLA